MLRFQSVLHAERGMDMLRCACLIYREQHVDQLQHAAIAAVWHNGLCQERQQIWVMEFCHDLDLFLRCYKVLIASSQNLQAC